MSLFTDLNDTKTILNWTGTVLTETITGKSYRNTFQREQEFALLVAVNVITENGITGLYLEDVLDIAYHIGRTAEGEVMNGDFKKAYSVMKYGYENSSKRGKAANALLYHLVLCCKRLNKKEDIDIYEKKLQSIEKI
jgi:CRISPR/Cas system type I-B associated protein Csh2 (Cas7 group RAMP superfamily)